MQVGTIFGSVATTEFRFRVTDPTLKRTDYVQVRHPSDGWVLAQVVDIVRENRAPGEGDRLVASSKAIGFRDERGILQAPRTPFPSDAPVHRAEDSIVADVFGLRSRQGAFLGFVKGYDLHVHLDVNTLVQKHVSVLAKTGSGKSYVVGVLIEELLKKGVPVVVIDPHGEYASIGRPNARREDWRAMQRFGVKPRGYADAVVEYSPDPQANPDCAPLTLEDRNPGAAEVVELLGGSVPAAQMGILHHAVKTLREGKRSWTIADVLDAVLASTAQAKWTLASSLEHLVGLGIFQENGTPVGSLVLQGKVSVVNLKGVGPELADVVVARLVRRVFDARKTNRVPPFLLVVEEAHNFCPERGLSTALAGDVLRTVASEGRKFGMGLAIITQRPAKVDKNVLSQCNTQIILKVTNPNDLKAIQASVEGLTADAHDEIQRLPVGVAIVSHPPISVPLLVEVRPRETAHGGESVDVMESWTRGRATAAESENEDEDEDEDRSANPEANDPEEGAKATDAPLRRGNKRAAGAEAQGDGSAPPPEEAPEVTAGAESTAVPIQDGGHPSSNSRGTGRGRRAAGVKNGNGSEGLAAAGDGSLLPTESRELRNARAVLEWIRPAEIANLDLESLEALVRQLGALEATLDGLPLSERRRAEPVAQRIRALKAEAARVQGNSRGIVARWRSRVRGR